MSNQEDVARLFEACRELISADGAAQVEHYLQHGEHEMALEGLVLELMAEDVAPPGFRFSAWKDLAQRIGLAGEPVFDGEFWSKFLAWGRGHSAIDFLDFVLTGRFGPIEPAADLDDLVAHFGEPDVFTPQRKSYPAMLVYGDLEFRLRDRHLHTVALSLEAGAPSLPEGITLTRVLQGVDRRLSSCRELLERHGVRFERDEVMSDASHTVLVTERGVHLAFTQETLVRVVATTSPASLAPPRGRFTLTS